MSIKLGNSNITLKVGSSAVTAAYLGSIQVYPNSIPPTPTFDGKYKLTLSNGDVISAACDGTSAITRNEISAYSQTCVSAVVGDCVTTISTNAFSHFHSLSSVTISDSVVNIYSSFSSCNSLTSIGDKGSGASIELPTGLTTIEDSTFDYCTGLTSVTIPSSITKIGYAAFGDCISLPSIEIPNNVTHIGGYAFANCSGLTSITVNATVPPSSDGATSNWYAFNNTNDCPIYCPCESVNSYKQASGWASYSSRITCIP